MRSFRLKILTLAEFALFFVGLTLLAYCALVWTDSWLFQWQGGRWLDRVVGASLDPQHALDATRRRGVLGRLEIPRISLATVVIDDAGDESLRRAAGMIAGSALPGFDGNVAIAGHRDTQFRPLQKIRNGDLIRLVTGYGEFHYEVVGTERVEPDRVDVLDGGSERVLTLVTCYPFDYIGLAPQRFIVHARETERRFFAGP